MQKNKIKYQLTRILAFLYISMYIFMDSANGQEVYTIDPQYPVHDVNPFLLTIADKENAIDVSSILNDTSFQYVPGDQLPQYLESWVTYWGKLKLTTQDSLKGWTLNFRDYLIGTPAWTKSNGKVDVFAYADNKLLFHKKTGVEYAKKERDVKEKWVLNRVQLDEIPLNKEVTLVIKVQGNNMGYPPFFKLSVRSPNEMYYHEIYQRNNSFNIFMLGVTFIIFLYHLLQYFYLRQPVFLYFSIWLFVCTLIQAMASGGILGLFTHFRFPILTTISNSIFFAFWFFGRSFLESRKKFPLLDKCILALVYFIMAEVFIVVLANLFFGAEPFMLQIGIHYYILTIYTALSIVLSVIIAFQNDNFARYFGVGATIGSIFLFIGSLWSSGMIRMPPFDPYVTSMFFQIIIFSFGIAYRRQVLIKKSNEEKLEAQKNYAEMRRMRDLDEIKTKFFANISHEFRTPLSLILGPLNQVVKKKKQYGSPDIKIEQKTIDVISRNASRLQTLVDQLLDLSKLESGHVHLSLTQGDILKYIKSIVHSFESLAERKGISFNTSFGRNGHESFYDKDKLEKILTNLISNAFKYTPENGTVYVNVELKNENLHFEVSDTGKGIAKQEIGKIFERFYRIEGSEEKGSGIGLALVKELVELHKGNISVSSTLDVGTKFKVILPLSLKNLPDNVHVLNSQYEVAKPEVYATLDSLENEGVEKLKSDPQKEKESVALVVEDNNDLRTYITDILKSRYRVLTAEDGAQGERMAFEHIPDIVISDIMMPKKDGYELCNILKNNQKTSHIPVIMLTAKAGQTNKLEGLTIGADAYLTKPFNEDELLIRVGNLIEARKKIWDQFQSLDLSLMKEMELESIDNQFLQEVFHVIKDNLDNEYFSVEDIAREVGFSRSQLHRKLKAIIDKSANQLIVETRMNEAKQMLEKKTGSVSEISYSVGYSNLPYFTKSFKKHFGVLPSEVSKAKRNPS